MVYRILNTAKLRYVEIAIETLICRKIGIPYLYTAILRYRYVDKTVKFEKMNVAINYSISIACGIQLAFLRVTVGGKFQNTDNVCTNWTDTNYFSII